MKKTITSRIEILLAKLAGQDVSLSTMAPGVPINLSEKLMLDIADRLDRIEQGGGSGSGGKVAKILFQDNGDGPVPVNLIAPSNPEGTVISNELIVGYNGDEGYDVIYDVWLYDGDFSDFGTANNPVTINICDIGPEGYEEFGSVSQASAAHYTGFLPPESGTSAFTDDQLVLTDQTYAVEVQFGGRSSLYILPSNAVIATGTYGQDDGGGGDDTVI